MKNKQTGLIILGLAAGFYFWKKNQANGGQNTGSGYSIACSGQMPIHFSTPATFPGMPLTLIWTHVAADTNDSVKFQIYPGSTGFTFQNSSVQIERIE